MGWLFAIVVLILLVVSAGFRKAALGLVIFAVLAIGAYYLYVQRQEKLSHTRIAFEQVKLINGTTVFQNGTYHMVGRLTNESPKYTLVQIDFNVTASDCIGFPPAQTCTAIGESKESLYLDIPPKQARDFDKALYFSGDGLKSNGQLKWRYTITAIKAEKPDA